MEEKTQIETLLVHVKDFLKENFNLLVLNTYEKVSRIISGITSVLFLSALLVFILVFVSIGLALWTGKMMNEPFAGFFLVGGIYLLLGLVFYINREKWIRVPMIDVLLKNITDEKD
jgi:hypothetical protein